MIEKTEWEVVDAPTVNKQQSPQQALNKAFGPWWRWKLAAVAAMAMVALVFFAAIAGVFLVLIVTGVVICLGVRAVLRLLFSNRAADITLRNRK